MEWARIRKGQTVVIVALCMLALVAFVGLAVDGGSTLLQRRTMQNAADAGALAAIQVMQEGGIAVTCVNSAGNATTCHPTYLVTSHDVVAKASQFVAANAGGTTGSATPTAVVEYHLMAGAPGCASGCYQAAVDSSTQTVPDWADGVRVTASIQNPTTFARAVNISTIPVSAPAATRVYATCPVAADPGPTLPFTRFRPALEEEMLTSGNDRLHAYRFWTSTPDFNGSWKDTLSFRHYSFNNYRASGAADYNTQLLTGFDTRRGLPSSGGVGPNYNKTGMSGCPSGTSNCADMGRQKGDDDDLSQDLSNWIYWNWNGTIVLTSTWPSGAGVGSRTGDWAESYKPGDLGNNLASPITDLIARDGFTTPLSGAPFNLGKAVDRTVYVWGPSRSAFLAAGSSDSTVAQKWVDPVPPGHGNGGQDGQFTDITVLQRANGNYETSGNDSIDRVRFTWAYKFRFYAALQSNNSAVYGLFLAQDEPGPQPGSCTWLPGVGVYSRLSDP